MITADEARKISSVGRWKILDELIRYNASKKLTSLSLYNTGFGRLNTFDKKMLSDNGFIITEGDSHKHGKFDIISW